MADELQTGICGGNWWNSSRSALGTSQCSSFGWSTDVVVDMMKVRSTCDEDDQSANSVCDNSSMVFQDIHQKPQPVDSGGGGGGLMDSTLQMLGFGLSPSSATTSDWNSQTLLRSSERTESNYHSVLQEEDMSSRLNYRQESGMDCHQIQSDWTSKNFAGGDEDSTIDAFKTMNQNFSQGSASYGYPSSLVQSLFEPEPQTQQTPFDNSRSMTYQPAANFREEFSPSWPKISQILKPSMPKQQPTSNHLHFSNNTPFWNASAAALNDIRTSFLASDQFLSTTFQEKPSCANLTAKHNPGEVRDSGSLVKKSSSEPTFKRPRIETPSPLPTFKVRKEKLGDRITALQQLVSPFGKTDTASVLHEAIEYIKFLHDQVSVLSTPYMKNGAPNGQHQQISDKLKDSEMPKQDLRSRGLCLVPISSTYPVASETTADFWTPTFGGTFR